MTVRAVLGRANSTVAFAAILILAIVFGGVATSALNARPQLQTAATIFASIFVQAMPFLVLGVLVSGLIAAFVSPLILQKLLPQNNFRAVGVAGLAGVALPGCECAAVPIARRLIEQGAAPPAALAFLLAAPAVNPIVLVATAVAFPDEPGMVAARFAGSLATALVVGWLWPRIGKGVPIDTRMLDAAEADGPRWQVFASVARHDFLDAAAFLVVGAAAATALRFVVPESVFEHLASQMLLAILVMAVLAVVLALCSEADAFVAASMSALPLLPRLVFLVVGPAIDVKLIAMQAGTFGREFVLRFAPTVFVVAVCCGTLAGYLFLGGAR